MSVFDNFEVDIDEFGGYSWVKHKKVSPYVDVNKIFCYFQLKEDKPTILRFKLNFTAEDWLFIESCQFLIDGNRFDYFPSDVERDTKDGVIWEYFDDLVTSDNCTMVEALSSASACKVRLNGTKYYEVVEFSKKQLEMIKETLDLYKSLGGDYNN